ncbi:MAG: hypothetical protein FWG90_12245 [Oscillospiraceae bacterium]|nr:hypothetical protein [Oscillospiraceae bacterium]
MKIRKNGPTDLENALYKNAVTGAAAIKSLYPNVRDRKLERELRGKFKEYQKQSELISGQLRVQNKRPAGPDFMSRFISDADIKLSCMKNSSTENIAKMMYQNSAAGVVKVQHALNNSNGDSQRVVSVAKSVISKEQKFADRLKNFL